MKKPLFVILILIFCIIFPSKIIAQVVINEFQLSPADNQWIELYNKGDQSVDISGWSIDDTEGSNSKVFIIPSDTSLLSKKCISFKSGNFSWNTASADKVRLISPSGSEIYSYSSSPDENISIGRVVDGEGDLVILASESRDAYNSTAVSCLAPISTLSPSPTSSLSPTSIPIPYKAVYQINISKDKTGSTLSGVQIYIDGIYIHHEDDEIIQFFNGHECYSGVECSLGTHTISIRKTGYLSWEDTRDFTAGLSLEVNPVLEKINANESTPTSSPVPTKSPTPTSTKTPLPTPTENSIQSVSSSSAQSVLVLESSNNIPTSSPVTDSKNNYSKFPFLAVGLITIGLGFIGFSLYSIIKNVKKEYTDESEGQDSQIS